MFYLDSNLLKTRRDSSLLRTVSAAERIEWENFERQSLISAQVPSTSENVQTKAKDVENEIITLLFDSMVSSIATSWTTVEVAKDDAKTSFTEITDKELKKKKSLGSSSKAYKKAKKQKNDSEQETSTSSIASQSVWWNQPDEKAVILFSSGDTYEGNISHKCMHGEGKYMWSDGTSYLGNFHYNEIRGRGRMEWPNGTWYEGEFYGNVRHGKGMFVDPHDDRYYMGDWCFGMKHGEGKIGFNSNNTYEGTWVNNKREGFGKRKYSDNAVYKGYWLNNSKEGTGIIVWPNHDYYNGRWRRNQMHGFGKYIWSNTVNNSLSIPSLNTYQGTWFRGQRHGSGVINFGFPTGSSYTGEFLENKKHGEGILVTGYGSVFKDEKLFIEDMLVSDSDKLVEIIEVAQGSVDFNSNIVTILTATDRLVYFIKFANTTFGYTHRVNEIAKIAHQFLVLHCRKSKKKRKLLKNHPKEEKVEKEKCEESEHEELPSCLEKIVVCHEKNLRKIYYHYATLYNKDKISFEPVLIRLYFWQLCHDCDMHARGLTMEMIDTMLAEFGDLLIKSPHQPFERIYFWQFVYSLIVIGYRFCQNEISNDLPMLEALAKTFKIFMGFYIIPGVEKSRTSSKVFFKDWISIHAMYKLYKSIGEPHTIRDFMKCLRQTAKAEENRQDLKEESDHINDTVMELTAKSPVVEGKSVLLLGEDIVYETATQPKVDIPAPEYCLRLFNISNISCKCLLHIFGSMFVGVIVKDCVVDADKKLTFHDFYNAMLLCVEKSLYEIDSKKTSSGIELNDRNSPMKEFFN